MFHKAIKKSFNHHLKDKSQHDVTIESSTVHKFSEKIDLPSKQTTKIHKSHN